MDNSDYALYEKLSQLQWLLQRHNMQSHMEHGPFADTTRGQGRVLAILKMAPEISTKDLSYMMGIRHQSLNELLNKLEKTGYITRSRSEGDRRVTMVRLTEKGQSEQQQRKDFSDIFDCLSPEEQASFADYLDRVIAALKTQMGVDEDWDEDMDSWVQAARGRMGNEKFDRLMAMRGDFQPRGPRPHDHRHDHRHDHDRGFYRGYENFDADRRCPPPPPPAPPAPPTSGNIHGAEGFAPSGNGPRPNEGPWHTDDVSSGVDNPSANDPKPN